MSWSSLTALALLMLDQHGSFASVIPTPPTRGINWYACTQNASIDTTCGTLDVPLDYTAATSNESLTLHLVKINATTQPSKGSIIFDFGGPGNINVDSFAGSNGQALLLMTGGIYDLVTFQPRGTGITLPYSCYNSSAAGAAAFADMPQALGAPEGAIDKAWAVAGTQADACYQNVADIGRLVGTSFVARDIMQIVDGLREDGLLRYYGFSYGTTLGATVAAMFPDRIDKLLLDGVVNPTEYWTSPSYSFALDTDITLSAFFTGCIESPELCALAPIFSSAGIISRRVASLIEDLKVSPLALGSNNTTVTVTYAMVKSAIVSALYFPFTWSGVAELLAAVIEGNASALESATLSGYSSPSIFPNLAGPEVQNGIQCADKPFRYDDVASMQSVLARFEAESWIRGDGYIAIQALQCARWRFTSKERYEGTFDDIKTRYPALVVGNSIDPTTPLASARNLSEGLEGSVLLQNNGYGHTTIASPSLCTAKHVRAYFVDGTLPPVGTVCESVTSTQPLAFDGSYYEVIQPLVSNAPNVKRSVNELEGRDDVALFNAVRELGKGFARSKMGLRAV